MDFDNTEWINVNDYQVSHNEYDGYTAYDDNSVIFQIKPDGEVVFRTKTEGMDTYLYGLTIDDIKPNTMLKGPDGLDYYFDGESITYAKGYSEELEAYCEIIYNDDKCITKLYEQEGGTFIGESINTTDGCSIYKDYESNITNYYDAKDNKYCTENPDGTKEYFNGENVILTTYPDGTYECGDKKGTYTTDAYGNIICDDDGNQIIYNKQGEMYCVIDKDGRKISYDNQKGSKFELNEDKTTYTKIDHIEYDEESYNKILNTLNSVDGTSIITGCGSVKTNISSFPDSGYSSNIGTIESNINSHIKLVKSLSSMTNYSILAYQTCDEDLRKGLYLLIDSLFGENELGLGDKFKKDIQGLIEDRDNDKILEYREDTNFKILSDSAIVSRIITDENGNKWYLNRNNHVVGLEGKDIKINYGGETFNLSYDENGIIKLTDSNGKPINIFGDYNLESEQFGANQGDLIRAYNDLKVTSIINSHFPYVVEEEKVDLLYQAASNSCGYAAITNLIFKKYEGHEAEFYNKFGYPMYDLIYDENGGISVDYNYEPMIMDIYSDANNDENMAMSTMSVLGDGTNPETINKIEKYLKDKYDVTLDGYDKTYKYYGEHNYTLYDMDGTVYGNMNNELNNLEDQYSDNNDYHAMLGVDETSDGRPIVSSWGKKLILEKSTRPEDIKYGEYNYREYK